MVYTMQQTTKDLELKIYTTELIDLEIGKDLVIIRFSYRDIHKTTRRSPDGRCTNQIDHILIQKLHPEC